MDSLGATSQADCQVTATGLYVFEDGLHDIALPALGVSVCAAEMVSDYSAQQSQGSCKAVF